MNQTQTILALREALDRAHNRQHEYGSCPGPGFCFIQDALLLPIPPEGADAVSEAADKLAEAALEIRKALNLGRLKASPLLWELDERLQQYRAAKTTALSQPTVEAGPKCEKIVPPYTGDNCCQECGCDGTCPAPGATPPASEREIQARVWEEAAKRHDLLAKEYMMIGDRAMKDEQEHRDFYLAKAALSQPAGEAGPHRDCNNGCTHAGAHPCDCPACLACEKEATPPASEREIQAAAIREVMEIYQIDGHQWSKRPCSTCDKVTKRFGVAWGCVAYAALRVKP